MKSVLWNELRMGTKCVTPIDRLIRINPELVLSSIFSNAKNPAMLWYNLLFIYKNDSDAHVAVCQTAWLLHDLESEFSFSPVCFRYLTFTKGWNSDCKQNLWCSQQCCCCWYETLCVFFKASYCVVAAFMEFDHIFCYQFIQSAWMDSEII